VQGRQGPNKRKTRKGDYHYYSISGHYQREYWKFRVDRRPYSERPKTARPYSERPETARPYSERPETARPYLERPKTAKRYYTDIGNNDYYNAK